MKLIAGILIAYAVLQAGAITLVAYLDASILAVIGGAVIALAPAAGLGVLSWRFVGGR